MKQTAVEWLIEQWPILESQLPQQLIQQAKEMEKEQKGYSEKECYKILHNLMTDIKLQGLRINDDIDLKNWFEQNKK
jgi:ribosomal 50S subunit-associated protein YjgA (DUF615 family)